MNFYEKMKKKIRKSTGQDEPFTRPSEKTEEETRPGMFDKKELDEMNEARRSFLESLKKRKK